MIPVYAALAMFLATQAGLAQTPAPAAAPPATSAPAAPAPKHPARVTRLEQRFIDANTSHDGHLTLEQAKTAKMSSTVKHFATIDRGAKGYVTMDDMKTAVAEARAAKAAQKATTTKS
jgi:hypothetical protein